jgi:hypothetical protein
MSAEARDKKPVSRPAQPPRFSIAVFVAAAAAGAAGNLVAGPFGLAAAVVIALLGAVVAGSMARAKGPVARPSPQLDELARERERAARITAEQLEKTKRHAEIASLQFRDGKDPLTEVPELRVGPLRELLEAARVGVTMPVVNRLTMSEEELVATDGEPLPVPWPKDADGAPASKANGPAKAAKPAKPAKPAEPSNDEEDEADTDPVLEGALMEDVLVPAAPGGVEARAEMVRELDGLVDGLAELLAGFTAPRDDSAAPGQRTPAQLVDAVVHTAADGIEDLAAGLMRANELAGVAERVTNKATLLALNAALEATRSGSEAFAAIAEETRRLAEFAREATDTISRLSSEIEYKVGETITAIHATSEDAKSAVASFQTPSGAAARPLPTAAVERLLRRARDLKRRLVAEVA